MKYYIKSNTGTYFTNELIFNNIFENIMFFETIVEARNSIILYGLDNCIVVKLR